MFDGPVFGVVKLQQNLPYGLMCLMAFSFNLFSSELLISIKKPKFRIIFQELLTPGDNSDSYAAVC